MRALLASLLMFAGCGGIIAGGDGGTSGDGSPIPTGTPTNPPPPNPPPFDAGPPPPPPPSMCTPMMGSGVVSTNGCSVTEQWSCGPLFYQVTCDCPLGQCTCIPPQGGKYQVSYAGCPSCTVTGKALAMACSFPSK